MSKDLNDIINHILREERMKTEVVVTPIPVLRYRCDQEKYSIEYNEASTEAEYFPDGSHETILTVVPLAQRNYYVDSGYWKHEAKNQATGT